MGRKKSTAAAARKGVSQTLLENAAAWNQLKRASCQAGLVYVRTEPDSPVLDADRIRQIFATELGALGFPITQIISETAPIDSDPFKRTLFRVNVLLQLERGEELLPTEGRGAQVRTAREDLQALSHTLNNALATADAVLNRPSAATSAENAQPGGSAQGTAKLPQEGRAGRFEAVIFSNLGDIGAHPVTIARVLAAIIQEHVHVLVLKQEIDTRDNIGREKVRTILQLGALWQRAARARSSSVAAKKLESGEAFGQPRYGFTRTGDRFVPVPEELFVVRRILELRAQEKSLSTIADILNQSGMKDPSQLRRGRPWGKMQVQRVVMQAAKYESYLQASDAEGSAS
jgi:hypothetical protein